MVYNSAQESRQNRWQTLTNRAAFLRILQPLDGIRWWWSEDSLLFGANLYQSHDGRWMDGWLVGWLVVVLVVVNWWYLVNWCPNITVCSLFDFVVHLWSGKINYFFKLFLCAGEKCALRLSISGWWWWRVEEWWFTHIHNLLYTRYADF